MNAIFTFLVMIPFLLPIVVANFAERERSVRVLLFVYLGLLCGVLSLLGMAGLFAGIFFSNPSAADTFQNSRSVANATSMRALVGAPWVPASAILLGASGLAALSMLPALRKLIARVLPINPTSAMHVTALALTALAIGLNLWQTAILTPLLVDQVAQGQTMPQASYLDVLVFRCWCLRWRRWLGWGYISGAISRRYLRGWV